MKRIFLILVLILNGNIYCADKQKITVSAIGDIMAHDNLQAYALATDKGYMSYFEDTKSIFLRDDLTIANLETTVNDKLPVSGYPRFNAKTKLIDAIKESGIDAVSTANNHAIDNADAGVKSTIEALKSRGIIFSGSGLNPSESRTPVIIIIKNIKIGFFSMTATFNDPAPAEKKDRAFVNLAPAENIKGYNSYCDIIRNTKKNVDIMIVSYHSGDEYKSEPTPLQQTALVQIAEAGADIVLGHHPHVLQKVEYHLTKDNRKVLIAYSLGNFISAQAIEIPKLSAENKWIFDSRVTKTAEGMILLFDIAKSGETYSAINPRIIPTFNLRFTYKNKDRFFSGFRVMTMNDILQLDEKNNMSLKNLPDIKKIIIYRLETIKKLVGLPVISLQ